MLDNNTYKAMYPTSCGTPKFSGLPKIHKPITPLRPIVSSHGLVIYGVAKEYYQGSIGKRPHPQERNSNVSRDIFLLLEFCLKNTYLSFQGHFYERVEGMAMGSPVSPIITNLYMEYFEQKALSTAPIPRLCCQYVDDTFVIQMEESKQNFLQHMNSVDPAIQFTVENNKEDGPIPFLDTTVKPETDSKLSITVCRKPTHLDQYLQWDSHHHLSAKYSVISTPIYRAKTVCSNPELLQKEMEHLRKALTNCKYPKWVLDKVEKRLTRLYREVNDGVNSQVTAGAQPVINVVKTKGHIVIPYTQDL